MNIHHTKHHQVRWRRGSAPLTAQRAPKADDTRCLRHAAQCAVAAPPLGATGLAPGHLTALPPGVVPAAACCTKHTHTHTHTHAHTHTHTHTHQTYVNNVNAALDKFPELKDLGLVDLNKAVGSAKVPADVATAVRNNGGGHWCVWARCRGCWAGARQRLVRRARNWN